MASIKVLKIKLVPSVSGVGIDFDHNAPMRAEIWAETEDGYIQRTSFICDYQKDAFVSVANEAIVKTINDIESWTQTSREH